MTAQESFERFELDPIRQLLKNAEEEYSQTLDEYERQFGSVAREKYEERYV
jgi:hypothetical protein